MDLCVAFGEPSPERFISEITEAELRDWMSYAVVRGLPAHLPRQIADLHCSFSTSKGAKGIKPEDFLLYRKREKPTADLRTRIKHKFEVIGKVIANRQRR